jgi:hypothetical protein
MRYAEQGIGTKTPLHIPVAKAGMHPTVIREMPTVFDRSRRLAESKLARKEMSVSTADDRQRYSHQPRVLSAPLRKDRQNGH